MFKKKVAILTLVSVISSFSANTTAVLAHELTKNEEKISTQETQQIITKNLKHHKT